jgi:hypothetical protein
MMEYWVSSFLYIFAIVPTFHASSSWENPIALSFQAQQRKSPKSSEAGKASSTTFCHGSFHSLVKLGFRKELQL